MDTASSLQCADSHTNASAEFARCLEEFCCAIHPTTCRSFSENKTYAKLDKSLQMLIGTIFSSDKSDERESNSPDLESQPLSPDLPSKRLVTVSKNPFVRLKQSLQKQKSSSLSNLTLASEQDNVVHIQINPKSKDSNCVPVSDSQLNDLSDCGRILLDYRQLIYSNFDATVKLADFAGILKKSGFSTTSSKALRAGLMPPLLGNTKSLQSSTFSLPCHFSVFKPYSPTVGSQEVVIWCTKYIRWLSIAQLDGNNLCDIQASFIESLLIGSKHMFLGYLRKPFPESIESLSLRIADACIIKTVLEITIKSLTSRAALFETPLHHFDDLISQFIDQLLSHITWLFDGLLHDVQSFNWTDYKPFYENERCSFPIQMWHYQMERLCFYLQKLPWGICRQVYSTALVRGLTRFHDVYLEASPTPNRLIQFRSDIMVLLNCAMVHLERICSTSIELLIPVPLKMDVFEIHSLCTSLSLISSLLSADLDRIYKTLRKPKSKSRRRRHVDKIEKLDFADFLSQNQSIWLQFVNAGLYGEPFENLSTSQLSALTLRIACSKTPETPLALRSTIVSLIVADCTVATLLVTHLVESSISVTAVSEQTFLSVLTYSLLNITKHMPSLLSRSFGPSAKCGVLKCELTDEKLSGWLFGLYQYLKDNGCLAALVEYCLLFLLSQDSERKDTDDAFQFDALLDLLPDEINEFLKLLSNKNEVLLFLILHFFPEYDWSIAKGDQSKELDSPNFGQSDSPFIQTHLQTFLSNELQHLTVQKEESPCEAHGDFHESLDADDESYSVGECITISQLVLPNVLASKQGEEHLKQIHGFLIRNCQTLQSLLGVQSTVVSEDEVPTCASVKNLIFECPSFDPCAKFQPLEIYDRLPSHAGGYNLEKLYKAPAKFHTTVIRHLLPTLDSKTIWNLIQHRPEFQADPVGISETETKLVRQIQKSLTASDRDLAED